MLPRRTLGWWYWLATALLLAAHSVGAPLAIWLTITLTLVQCVHYTILEKDAGAFSVQIRMAFWGLLLLGLYPSLRFLHDIQLAGTTAVVLFDYCLLARVLALMPWNRNGPFSAALAMRTIFSRPTAGCTLQTAQSQNGSGCLSRTSSTSC